MLSNKQKMKKCNEVFSNFKDLISGKYKEYKRKKLENPQEEVMELKKHNKKVFWKSLGIIGLFFSGSMIVNYIFFSFVCNFKKSPFGDVGNMVGFINAAIENNDNYLVFWILLLFPIISTLLLTSAAFIEGHVFNFKSKGFFILNEEEFKLNYVLSKEELEREYKRIEQIINKEELQEIMFKVNKRLNDNTIDIGSSIFIKNVYKELKSKMKESEINNKNKIIINKKLNYVLK